MSSHADTAVIHASRSSLRPRPIAGIGVLGNVAAALVALFILLAIIGPWIAPHDPNLVSFDLAYGGPEPGHWLGFDSSGRDLLSRLLTGARSSLLGPLLVAVLASAIGTAIALVAAWFRGWTDSVIGLVLDILFAFPGLVLAMLAVAVFGRGLVAPSIALVIAYVPYFARIVRSATMVEASSPYVSSLKVQGLSGWAISTRHIFVNVRPTVVAQAMISFSFATVDLAALSYLGLGAQAPSSDWGLMVAEGQEGVLEQEPAEAMLAGACLVLAVVAINVLGTRLMDRAEARG